MRLWEQCCNALKAEISQQEFNTWILPLHIVEVKPHGMRLLAPNCFVLRWVTSRFLPRINQLMVELNPQSPPGDITIEVGSQPAVTAVAPVMERVERPDGTGHFGSEAPATASSSHAPSSYTNDTKRITQSNLNPLFTFDNFIEGKSNQLARTAAMQVAQHPGQAYNPLYLYGGVGLGKTHLIHAMGNYILQHNPDAKVLYLHSERFVADMIKALQRNAMNDFKRYYRSANALLIDDIQFFAGKDRSQEEFFHTFNTLLDGQQQIVLTCDRYPKEVSGLEERLQSRFGWGLTVAVEPPDLETRVAILMTKAEQVEVNLSSDVAFFIAKNIQSNVRELEGALKRVIANSHFTGQSITIAFAREALKDLLTLQAKLITVDNIQRTVADYYKVKVSDLLSKRRNRSIARPRQIAMSLAKQLTNHSLPEIGEAFSGRDHTTVLHACKKIKELSATSLDIQEDWKNLLRILST